MNRRYWAFCAATAMFSTTIAQPTVAQQGAPTPAELGRALRPIPQALQGGHQGLPTVGAGRSSTAITNFGPSPATVGRTHTGKARAAAPQTAQMQLLKGCVAPPAIAGKAGASLPQIIFEFGSAQLKPDSIETLRNLGKALNENLSDQKLFEIDGHTDAVGTLAYNEELSKLRAEAVKDFLTREMGVSPDRLAVVGKGFCEPADPGNPYSAENRRVVVINQGS